jgi:hypothetical protein
MPELAYTILDKKTQKKRKKYFRIEFDCKSTIYCLLYVFFLAEIECRDPISGIHTGEVDRFQYSPDSLVAGGSIVFKAIHQFMYMIIMLIL